MKQNVVVLLIVAGLQSPALFSETGGGGQGTGQAIGQGTGGGGQNQPSPPPEPPGDLERVRCVVIPDSNVSDLSEFINKTEYKDYIKDFFDTVRIGGTEVKSLATTRFPDRAIFRAYCGRTDEDDPSKIDVYAHFDLKSEFREDCGSGASGICTEFASLSTTSDQRISIEGRSLKHVGAVVLRNVSSTVRTVQEKDVELVLEKIGGTGPGRRTYNPSVTVQLDPPKPQKCKIAVSGALNPQGAVSTSCSGPDGCNPEMVSDVANGDLLFQLLPEGSIGITQAPKSVTWSSSPSGISATKGIWTNPPLSPPSVVTAKVTTKNNEKISCSVKIQPIGNRNTVKVQRGLDCYAFQALRRYYLLKSDQKTPLEQFTPPVSYIGYSDIKYGSNHPEVPFTGAINSAADFVGNLTLGLGGIVQLPPLSDRPFSKTIAVAYLYRPDEPDKGVTEPLFWGTLNPNDYYLTQFAPIGNPVLKDDDLVVFQIFGAGVEREPGNPGNDLRGTPGHIPFYQFTLGLNDKPFDKVVPLLDDSCAPPFQLQFLEIRDESGNPKPLPQVLKSLTACMFSRPFRAADFTSGRVVLKTMHMVPMDPANLYPVDLLRGSRQPPCVAANPSVTRDCWTINPKDMPPKLLKNQYNTQNRQCFGYNWVGNQLAFYVLETRCPVLVGDECARSLEYRLAYQDMMMGASLGCAVKYDQAGSLSGIAIAPHLNTSTNYKNVAASVHYGLPVRRGYGCINCRFAFDAANAKATLGADNNYMIHSFTKTKAPANCVQDTKFVIRHWGASACDDNYFNLEASCWGSIPSCPNDYENIPGKGDFKAGGNILGSYTAPLCPGSQMEFDSISLSYSPLIVDVKGRGIQISRDFEKAIGFDIRGTGKRVIVDWPMNTEDVAFLVRPNRGRVSSIKELFGDHQAKNGFEALRALDSNKDGVIDANDSAYALLRLWFDRNRNGIQEKGELATLKQWNVDTIHLHYSRPVATGDEKKTLSGVYFNNKMKRFYNIEDLYFYEYWKEGKRVAAQPSERKRP